MLTLPEVRVGDPLCHEGLAVFPLFDGAGGGADYLLSDEALAAGAVTVEELTEGGSVPTLVVNNPTESLVLFLEGEELRGAKQNRVLNTSVLAGARAKTPIPVSCVEQGRWRYNSASFGHGGTHSSPKLRTVLKESVTRAAKEGRGHDSDQGGVWKEVSRQMTALGASSVTAAMADTYQAHGDRLAEFRARLPYVEGASGLAVAVGGKGLSLDLFDKPATCRKVWARLLTGAVMDALEAGPGQQPAGKEQVEQALAALRGSAWQQVPPVGVGEEYRSDAEAGRHATALVLGRSVVHGSLVVAG
ncbi:MAG TPA: DUF6569 family protein [Gemmataceae bacterium]|nr:DUF6569 family protein [Gemmataceae bacterium]